MGPSLAGFRGKAAAASEGQPFRCGLAVTPSPPLTNYLTISKSRTTITVTSHIMYLVHQVNSYYETLYI